MSGAPIGDTSIMIYPAGGMTPAMSMTLSHPLGQDAFTVSNVTSLPSYMHVYRVDQVPNATCGLITGGADRYFGVFVPMFAATQYDITYHYGTSPYFIPMYEILLVLSKRNMNSDVTCPAWSNANATLHWPGDSLFKATMSGRKEFILDRYSTAILAGELVSLKAGWVDEIRGISRISWSMMAEMDIDRFTVEKSTDGMEWDLIGTVQPLGNTGQQNDYSLVDDLATDPMSYYRVSQVDNQEQLTSYPVQSLERNGNGTELQVYPNPAADLLQIDFNARMPAEMLFQLHDSHGALVATLSTESLKGMNVFGLWLKDLENGLYHLTISENGQPIHRQKVTVLHN
jgi:hypothetical protein